MRLDARSLLFPMLALAACSSPDAPQPLVCTSPMADCDGNAANGCEANLLGDVKNCGRCGHDCGGAGACSNFGECNQVFMATNENGAGLATDATYVYWTTSKGANVRRVHRDADEHPDVATTLVTTTAGAADVGQHGLVRAGSRLFWVTPGGPLRSVSTAGGAVDTVADEAGALAAQGDLVYFTKPSDGSIWSVSAAGGAPVSVVSGETTLGDLAVSDDGLFWLRRGIAGTSEGAVMHRLPSGDVVEFSPNEPQPDVIGAGAGTVVWCKYGGDLRAKQVNVSGALARTLSAGTCGVNLTPLPGQLLFLGGTGTFAGGFQGGGPVRVDLTALHPTVDRQGLYGGVTMLIDGGSRFIAGISILKGAQ